MSTKFVRVREHWEASLPAAHGGRVVFSELPRGDSPLFSTSICLNLVLVGSERYDIAGRTHNVAAGQLVLLDGGIKGRTVLPQRTITRGLCIYLPARLPGASSADGGPPVITGAIHLDAGAAPFARRLTQFGHALTQGAELSPRAASRVVLLTSRMIDCLAVDLSEKMQRTGARKPSTRQEIVQRIERARAFINDNPEQVTPLCDLSAIAGMSQFHFARCFRAVIGMSPIAYGTRLQLHAAHRLLRSGVPIEAVAERLGFADRSSFSRAFRRIFGTTPGAVLPVSHPIGAGRRTSA